MQILFVILDGLADRPQPELEGRTPLDAACTPHLDRLAELGTTGLLTPLAPGVPVESDTAHFLLFGYDLDRFPGRAAFEAIGRGVQVPAASVVLLASFAHTTELDGKLRRDAVVRERLCDGDEDDCAQLARSIADFQAYGVAFRLTSCGGGEAVLTLTSAADDHLTAPGSESVSRHISDVDPLYDGAYVALVQPLAEATAAQAAQRTAAALNAYLGWVYRQLVEHPLNHRRLERGRAPINFLVTKWAAVRPDVSPFDEQNGLRAASVENYPLYVGLARVCGMTPVGTPPDARTSDVAADFAAKLRMTDSLFAQGYEFVHVHSKAPDVAAHRKDPRAKRAAIEALDSVLRPVVAAIADRPHESQRLVVVTGDHATPSNGPLIHSGEAVPILVVGGPNVLRDEVGSFSERAVISGGLGHIRARDVMPLLLNYTDRACLHGVRHQSEARLYWQHHPQPFVVGKRGCGA